MGKLTDKLTKALSSADKKVVADEAAATVRDNKSHKVADAEFEASIANLPALTQEVERERRKGGA